MNTFEKFMIVFNKLWGRDPNTEEKIDEKRKEAHKIVNQTLGDILQAKKETEQTNIKTGAKLDEVSEMLKSITYKIAVAQGGRKRGL